MVGGVQSIQKFTHRQQSFRDLPTQCVRRSKVPIAWLTCPPMRKFNHAGAPPRRQEVCGGEAMQLPAGYRRALKR